MALPIEQYGIIGDCQTAALVGSDGSIDWLCFPVFDSPACFAALLGTRKNGRWQIAPAEPIVRTQRRYRGDTLILETDFETANGAVTLIDFMPPRGDGPDLVRMVVGRAGEVRMKLDLVIRYDYGSIVPWVRSSEGRLLAVAGPDSLVLDSPIRTHGEDLSTAAEFTVSAGERIPFVLIWFPSHRAVPPAIDPEQALAATDQWWTEWSSQCSYDGPYRDAVMRSLITLKALTFRPTGGIVAAPTTSLPEAIGGVRNWDYRFCWLRDATFTLYSLMNNGYTNEALAWRDWLLRAVAGDPTELHIMYSIYGNRRLPELELPWLSGYEDSRPVRTGNAASGQFQLDVYGEVLAMLHFCRRKGLRESEAVWQFEKALLRFLEDAWRRPDEGIWEVRGPRRHFVHSKVMAWVAFDRAIKGVEEFGHEGPVDRWRAHRQAIHDEVCREGFDAQQQSFVQYYGGKGLDASLLMIPVVGFLPPDDPRVAGTVAAVQRNLVREGLVDRYATQADIDGLPPGEGSFLPCSFWLADALLLLGKRDEAAALFERLLALRNDLGLISEEYDPDQQRMVGNFPQAFTHVGLVNTARHLDPLQGAVDAWH